MAYEMLIVDDLVHLASVGTGFRTDAHTRQTCDLIRIADAAADGGARVTFSGLAVRDHEELIRIAAAGRGNVTIDQ